MALHFHTLQKKRHPRDQTASSLSSRFPPTLAVAICPPCGQYITLRADVGDRELRRSYSLCSAPHEGRWQVAIKRVDGGQFSQWAHALLRVTRLTHSPPDGHFTLRAPRSSWPRSVLLLAAGSGITPVFSILKTLLRLDPASMVTLVYGKPSSQGTSCSIGVEDLRDRFLTCFQLMHTLSGEVQRRLPTGVWTAPKSLICLPARSAQQRSTRFTSAGRAR